MTLVLLLSPSLEECARREVATLAGRPPGVVTLDGRAFMYSHREKPDVFCYKETALLELPTEPYVEKET